MVFPIYGVALAVVSIAFFGLAAHHDDRGGGVLWVVASIGLWAISLFALGWGFAPGFLLQIGLFLAMTFVNMVRD